MTQVEGSVAPASVLVVDDELGPRESIRMVLAPRFRVLTVATGEQALDVLRDRQVDVVTLDLVMPGADGFATFQKIHELDPDLQIIIVSGGAVASVSWVPPDMISAWISKPFDVAALVDAVERAAAKTRKSRGVATSTSAAALRAVPRPAREGRGERKHDLSEMFSHDIKGRLNVVLGFVRLLREGRLDAMNAAHALDVIEGNAHQAVTLTVNFLHAEESDGGSLELRKTSASLNRIVEQVMEDSAPRARLSRLELQADLDPDLPSVELDVAMISRAVTNLLENAVHYSPVGDVVCLETRRFADVILLRVRDHGPGIPAEEIPGLFQRYRRGVLSRSRSSTGLGLYHVRRIAEAHGGSVSVTQPPDGGSAFVIALPLPVDANS